MLRTKYILIYTFVNNLNLICTELRGNTSFIDSCTFKDEPFSGVYKWYFSEVRTTTLIILHNKRYDQFFTEYIDALFKQRRLSENPIKIVKLSPLTDYHRLKRNTIQTSKEKYLNREYVSEISNGYVIITWNDQNLEHFLIEQPKNIIRNPRALHLIILIANWENQRCTDWNKDILRLLIRFWRRFGILNVLAKTPCSCERDVFHAYEPFYKNDTDWGQVRKFTMEQFTTQPFQYTASLNNLNKYPLKISMFPRVPTAVPFKELPHPLLDLYAQRAVYTNNLYGGLDGSILNALAEYLNFSPVVRAASDKIEYGYRSENGTFTGSLGDIVYRRSEISFNALFMKNYSTEEIEFTYPISNEELCLITPKALKIPQFMMIFQCFDINTWIGIFILLLVGTLIWNFIKNFDLHKENRQIRFEPSSDIIFLFLSAPIKLPLGVSHRFFITVYLLANIIFVGIFQSTLVTSFSTVSFFKDIRTLERFDMSGYKIGTTSRNLEDIFDTNDTSSIYGRLKEKTVILPYQNFSTIDRAAYNRDIAAVERKSDARLIILTNYIGTDGVPLLHIVNECPTTYFLSYLMPKGSPFLPKFNDVIRRFLEAGFLDKWTREMTSALIYQAVTKQETDVEKKPFSLEDIQSAFYILVIGLLVSVFVFVFEMFLTSRIIYHLDELKNMFRD